MQVDVTLENYRCFVKPTTLSLRPGFTAIVGVNNSGKSTLLRFFYEFRDLMIACNHSFIADGLTSLREPSGSIRVPDRLEVFSNGQDVPLRIGIRRADAADNNEIEFSLRREAGGVLVRFDRYATPENGPLPHNWRIAGSTLRYEGGGPKFDIGGLRAACVSLGRTAYFPAFRNAVNAGGTGGKLGDMEIGQSFVTKWRSLRQGTGKDNNRATETLTEDIRKLLNFEKLSIEPTDDNSTLRLYINGWPHRLDEVGSGVAQFILVLANAAISRPDWILIDEPELNLHPTLQIDFLTTLHSYARRGVIFATHSLGLARAVAQQIFATKRGADGSSELMPYETAAHLSELVGALNYSGYAQVGFRKVLLVEGPSEVLVMHQWLRLYNKDHEVLVIPLGGGSMINGERKLELQELLRITHDVFAVVDSERRAPDAPPEKTVAAFSAVCGEIGIKCCVTERRRTESYLSEAAAKRAFPTITASDWWSNPDDTRHKNPPWGKPQNWRVAREMTRVELDETDIGRFLRAL